MLCKDCPAHPSCGAEFEDESCKRTVKLVEEKFTPTNKQSTPYEDGICPECGAPVGETGGYIGSMNC
jgi:hypothetical protein